MQSILLPVHPEILEPILNGDADTLIRKLFPKDYVGWVDLYCTKGTPKTQLIDNRNINNKFELCWCLKPDRELLKKHIVKGKVVARFWCDKVEEIKTKILSCNNPHKPATFVYTTETLKATELLTRSCLNLLELNRYLFHIGDDWSASKVCGYAIHISKLEVFKKPIKLHEFTGYCDKLIDSYTCFKCKTMKCKMLTKAPRNYCYIEDYCYIESEE